MGYTIIVTINETTADKYWLVEKAVSHAGTWVMDDQEVLNLDFSATCGSLRFMNPPGRNNFIITFGIEQEKPWVSIDADLAPTQTCVEFIPTFFTPGTAQNGKREFGCPDTGNRDGAGVNVHAKIVSFQGTTFWANLDISN